MHRFNFDSTQVPYEEVKQWLAERDAAFCLLNHFTSYEGAIGGFIHLYDISILSETVALEFALSFPAKKGLSKTYTLLREMWEDYNVVHRASH